ncbi:hypothetical protein [Chryseobacterium profundimaris]|nr:hypothetical protein [Chryseobacterium profundimaris]
MNKKHFIFYTEYNQFYISSDKGKFLSSEILTDETSYTSRLSLENNALVVFTQSYGNIEGEIEVLPKPNIIGDYSNYDHVVEGGINVQSGELQILNCPDNNLELSLKIDPGTYRVRIYSSNLDSVKETDLTNDTDDDYYRIELWKSDDMERKVLKQYEYK